MADLAQRAARSLDQPRLLDPDQRNQLGDLGIGPQLVQHRRREKICPAGIEEQETLQIGAVHQRNGVAGAIPRSEQLTRMPAVADQPRHIGQNPRVAAGGHGVQRWDVG